MKFGSYDFKLRPVPTVAVVLLLPLLVGLGLWQLQRAEEKRSLQAMLAQRSNAPPLELYPAATDQQNLLFRSVVAAGRFDAQRYYLLDNQVYRGRAGYDVLMPLRIKGSDAVVVVNRGWVPLGPSRAQLPAVPTPASAVRIKGILSRTPGELLQLGSQNRGSGEWPRVILRVDLGRMQRELSRELFPYLLQIDSQSPHAFRVHWKPYVDSPQRHTSYAVQWFSMAGILLVLYAALSARRRRRNQ